MSKSEYDANKSGFTSYAHKPVIKPSITLCDKLKAIKLISVFKWVGVVTGVIVGINLTIEFIGV